MKDVFTQHAGIFILAAYFSVTVVIGWFSLRSRVSANSFLNATRALPFPVVILSYVSANSGALEILGLNAAAAQYGVQAFHFYWIGAIPAMIFLSIWVMPMYRRSGIRSVPEYFELRYGPDVRLLNACVVATMRLLLGGINLYAMAQVLQAILGLPFLSGVLLSGSVVLASMLLGGIRATIYNSILQMGLMLCGLVPLVLHYAKGRRSLPLVDSGMRGHLWTSTPLNSTTSTFDAIGVVLGLGFVLSFGYWCTDFVLMQRAFTARTDKAARMVPVWAGFAKLLFSMIGVLPGLAAVSRIPGLGHSVRYDQALPLLMRMTYGPVMLGLGLTALVAGLMSGLAANISAFSALWTQDIYRQSIRKDASESHYVWMGRFAYLFAAIVGGSASYLTILFGNLMEHIQLIFSIFASPFWAVFLLGIVAQRVNARGAIAGLISGASIGLAHLVAFGAGWIRYGSVMNMTFHGAIYSFTTAIVVGLLASPRETRDIQQRVLTLDSSVAFGVRTLPLWCLSFVLLSVAIALNVYWR
ncbi:solute:Na+ symporter, SSS family [Bryocella elongata]|uniref:Solute:Na+ symporter, SSS family n=1 Tax=Bryocella elongata TaxID=863522 RepID=A0A1H6BAX4_9BACT|nr:sodium/solute symporter [Bryocella elongata]SEG57326.1 solute:Na+ symporter, SSS family [Bryocella elongata]